MHLENTESDKHIGHKVTTGRSMQTTAANNNRRTTDCVCHDCDVRFQHQDIVDPWLTSEEVEDLIPPWRVGGVGAVKIQLNLIIKRLRKLEETIELMEKAQ